MDISELTQSYKGRKDDPKLYGELWSRLKLDQSFIHVILSNQLVHQHLQDLNSCLATDCIERRLVTFTAINCEPSLVFGRSITSEVFQAIITTIEHYETDPYDRGVCLCLFNTILRISECDQDITFLVQNMNFIEKLAASKANAVDLMEFIYLTATHPCIPEGDAMLWIKELYLSGILWWLRTNLIQPKKLDLLEMIFESTIKSVFHTLIQNLQVALRSQNILKPLQFCSVYEFTKLLKDFNLSAHCNVVDILALKLKAQKDKANLQILKYFTRPPQSYDEMGPRLFSEDLSGTGVWISPSRNMFIHALKSHMHEFVQFQYDVKNFLSAVNSRFSEAEAGLQGTSKYATSHFTLDLDEKLQFTQLKIDRNEITKNNHLTPEWCDLPGRLLILSKKNREYTDVHVREVIEEGNVLYLQISSRVPSDFCDSKLACVLNRELNFQYSNLKHARNNALKHRKKWSATDMSRLLTTNELSKSLLISNVFRNSTEIDDVMNNSLDGEKQKEKKRRVQNMTTAVSIDAKEGTWSNIESIRSQLKLELTSEQIKTIVRGLQQNICLVNGNVGTGKSTVLASILDNVFLNAYYHSFKCRTIVICDTDETCQKINGLLQFVPSSSVICWSKDLEPLLNAKLDEVKSLLLRVQEIAITLGIPGDHSTTIEAAQYFFQHFLKPVLQEYSAVTSLQADLSKFPLLELQSSSAASREQSIADVSCEIATIFEQLEKWQSLFLPGSSAKAAWESCDLLILTKAQFGDVLLKKDLNMASFQNLVICNASYFQPLEIWQALSVSTEWQKIIITGDFVNGPIPFVVQQFVNADMLQLQLTWAFDTTAEILSARSPHIQGCDPVPGLWKSLQLIKSPGEVLKNVNWDEAEYCVFLYAYLRLVGYPWHSISIVTLSMYQKHAVETEFQNWQQNPLTKNLLKPKFINSLDRNFSHRNEIIIVSTAGSVPNVSYLSRLAKRGLLILTCHSSESLQVTKAERYPNVNARELRNMQEILGLKELKSMTNKLLKNR
ncbi:LANO_0B05050g1_1 [Lachancea nothofagi CBS 11611]|uniref:LANO_0B05050g1_1 n=1 Tax=Lachancea nothofagi CBS 11611 TaxID=1266666 RepID=A0A1G4IYC3_9SACH|nr:LANO_0B05050g1_1 [Lachancea nothofagi CBS 11611]